MSQKDNFNKLNKGNNAEEPEKDIEYHTPASNARNLMFVQPDGEREFFCYSDLVRGKYKQESEEIELIFRADELKNVTLKGKNLLALFNALADHMPRKILCTDQRYEETKSEEETIVTEISIQKFE